MGVLRAELDYVMHDVGSEPAVVMVHYDAGPMGMLFAATKPEHTAGLILVNTGARYTMAHGDARAMLPAIDCPTLVLHRTAYPFVSVEQVRYLESHIEGARLVELPGSDDHQSASPGRIGLRELKHPRCMSCRG